MTERTQSTTLHWSCRKNSTRCSRNTMIEDGLTIPRTLLAIADELIE
jgi:hypothetical protein